MMQSKSAMAGNGVERYRLVNKPDEIVAVLRNGMTVITKRVATPVVAVRGVCATGGVYEGKWLGGGLSHLLEHLCAGGSCERRTEAENRNLLQEIGNDSNAMTNQDNTAFFVNTTPPHMEQAVDLVTGWMLTAKITREEYRREYEVVQRELEMGKGEPDRQFYYLSDMNRYRVSPARVPVIGYQEVIQGLSRDDVFQYYKLAYVPQNLTFCVVGDLDPEVMLAAVRRNVSDVVPGREFSHNIAPEPPVLAPRSLVASFPKLGQARLELAFPSVILTNPELYALDVLEGVLGAGDSSLLVQELRDDKQLVSGISVGDFTPPYVEGTFSVDMQLDPANVSAATTAVLDRLDSMKTSLVDPARLRRVKTQIKVDRVKAMMTAEDISTSLAYDFISTGDDHFGDRYVDRIQQVTAEQVRAVAQKYFDRRRLLTTLMLPSESPAAAGVPGVDQVLHGPTATAPATQPAVASAVRRVELPNHTVLLLKRITTSPIVSINMYALGGLTEETQETNGLGNLTMAMLQRGTTTRSAEQIAELFDSVGGDIETAGGNNSWHWNASCLRDDFDLTLGTYADVVTHPAFADAELAPMKERIDAGIDGQDADWNAQTSRYFKSVFFAASHSPYRLPVTGTKATVDRFTVAQVRQWYTDHVLRGPRVLAIFGDIDLDHAQALATKLLGQGEPVNARMTAGSQESPAPATAPTGPPAVDVLDVKVQQTQQALAGIEIGYQSDSTVTEPSRDVLDVDQTLAGGFRYPTGYLYDTLRGQGLVYVVEAQNIPGRSRGLPGTFITFAGCGPDKVTTVVDQMLLNIARLQGSPAEVQPDWFNRSKQLIATGDAMENQTPAEQAQTAALDELFGLGYDHHAGFTSRINTVTMDQARLVAQRRLRRCIVTVCTPDPSAVHVKPGLRTYDSFPPVDLTPRGVQHGPTFGK